MLQLLFIIISIVGFYYLLIKPQLYWWFKDVPQSFPIPIFGNTYKMIFRMENVVDGNLRDYFQTGENVRYSGFYFMNSPGLLVKDLDLISKITIKDFDHFVNHRDIINTEVDPYWGRNLLSLKDEKWREMRATLSPAFTASKMRAMFSLINECAQQFTAYYLLQNEEVISVDCKDTFTRYTTDVIATCAFGITVDSLKNRNNEFFLMGKELTDFSKLSRMWPLLVNMLSPVIGKWLGIRLIPKDVSSFFESIINETLRVREEKNIVRPDMIHLLMEARKGKLTHHHEEEDRNKETGFATVEESHIGKQQTEYSRKPIDITNVDITAQALIFFFGGFDTSSALMCFMAYELAVNSDVQEKLRQEVDDIWQQCKEKLTYDHLTKMKYMDMVMSEALRKWTPFLMTDRRCVKPYLIEPKYPHEKPVLLEKDDVIFIPNFAIQRDPKYFPNPDQFDPERFSDENRDNIVPNSYMPFGSGPRNCIGSRFALMETKTLFYHILSRFELTVIEKTQIPLKFSKKSFAITPENGFWIGLKLRK